MLILGPPKEGGKLEERVIYRVLHGAILAEADMMKRRFVPTPTWSRGVRPNLGTLNQMKSPKQCAFFISSAADSLSLSSTYAFHTQNISIKAFVAIFLIPDNEDFMVIIGSNFISDVS